jgi:mRNA-degrading endonuclease RelE of RelBE toxin-antitoxin system
MEYNFSRHAQTEMERRKISVDLVESVLDNPQQVISEKEGRKAYQSKIDVGGRAFLLRVIVVDDVEPVVVITVYKTSKIDKYWRAE